MLGFIGYVWKKYRSERKADEVRKRIARMVSDYHALNSRQLEEKYGNPPQAFAKLRWELYTARHGSTPETFYRDRKEGKLI